MQIPAAKLPFSIVAVESGRGAQRTPLLGWIEAVKPSIKNSIQRRVNSATNSMASKKAWPLRTLEKLASPFLKKNSTADFAREYFTEERIQRMKDEALQAEM